MSKKTIKIDESLCMGCSLCVDACLESAIQLVDGKAKLVDENHCDGLGRCLPQCPVQAIKLISVDGTEEDLSVSKYEQTVESEAYFNELLKAGHIQQFTNTKKQWPLQIQLVPAHAPYFNNTELLVAADCTGFACSNFSKEYMTGKTTIIACPKLDSFDYANKLTEIFTKNDIKSITVARMEVPCCTKIVNYVVQAIKNSNKNIPMNILTVSIDGNVNSFL